MLTPTSLYQDVGKKPLGKEPVETNLKRKSSSVGNGPQRVPVRTSRPTTTQTTTTRPRPTLPLRATAISNEPVFEIARDDLEDSMELEDVKVIDPVPIEPQSQTPLSQDEVEDLVEPETDDEEHDARGARPLRIWPELGTARAQRFQKEVDQIREVFEDMDGEEELDPNMVSEYADEIFEYMNELEVGQHSPSYVSSVLTQR